MISIELTTEAEALFSLLYREYCTRRNAGVRICAASRFGNDTDVQSLLAPHVNLDDLIELLWELRDTGMISASPGDNHVSDIELLRAGVAYMDHRFSRNLKTVSEFVSNLSSLVPWLR